MPVFTCESGSNWSDLLTSALFVILPAWVTFATKVNVLVTPTPIVCNAIEVSVPAVLIKSELETNCKPTGSTSFTSTFVAASGPALVTLMV